MSQDPQLRFWLSYAEREGALVEAAPDGALVLLPERLQALLELPEEILVTLDPEVAAESRALLLAPGHPALERASLEVLQDHDVSYAVTRWPIGPDPAGHALLQRARDDLSVDHGKFELAGPPVTVRLPVCRIGALVTYHTDRPVQEREEVWIDASAGLPLDPAIRRAIEPLVGGESPRSIEPCLTPDLERTFATAEHLFDERARTRLAELARESLGAQEDERRRVDAYYEAVLNSIGERRERATPERRALYDAQTVAVRDERGRRLRELDEAQRTGVERRPFRLHLLLLPAMLVPLDVCRGSTRHPFQLIWLHATRRFLPARCPRCGELARLVAGRHELGCARCLAAPQPVPPPRPAAVDSLAPAVVESPPAPQQDAVETVPEPAVNEGTQTQLPLFAAARPDTTRPVPPPGRRPPPSERVPPGDVGADDGAEEEAREEGFRAYRELQSRVLRISSPLAYDFWRRVADRRPWRRVGADSPLTALYRLYGPSAPLLAIGAHPEDAPQGVESWTPPFPRVDGQAVTWGMLRTEAAELPFAIRWRVERQHAAVDEVLAAADNRERWCVWPATAEPAARAVLTVPPPPRCRLDAVGKELWEVDLPRIGLTLLVRCFATWWRPGVADEVADLEPEAIAGAVVSIALAEVSGRPTRAALADAHGVTPKALTHAVQRLRQVA